MKFKILKRLYHNFKQYEEGEAIDLPEGDATEHLLKTGVLIPVSEDEVSVKEKVEEPPKLKVKIGKGEKPLLVTPEEIKAGLTPTMYCLKCRQVRKMTEGKEVVLKSGRRALQGRCQACGGKMSRMLPKKK